jgi:hypothetical protein
MQTTLSHAVERVVLDVERFLEVWPLFTSHGLLQHLEASSGKTVSVYVAGPDQGPERIEILLDCDAGRAALDSGSGLRLGSWLADGSGARIPLEDGSGEWHLSGTSPGATATWRPKG